MIEEQGQVMAVDGERIRVAVSRQSACGSCKARAACGQGLMQTLNPGRCHEVLALCELPVSVGDRVILGLNESLALRSALLVYLFPLLALLLGTLLAEALGLSEGWLILTALLMFAMAFVCLYFYNKSIAGQSAMLPRVLRVEPAHVQDAIFWQP